MNSTVKQENCAVVLLYVLMVDTPTIGVMCAFFSIYVYFCVQKFRCARFLLCSKPLPTPRARIKFTHNFLLLRYIEMEKTFLENFLFTLFNEKLPIFYALEQVSSITFFLKIYALGCFLLARTAAYAKANSPHSESGPVTYNAQRA